MALKAVVAFQENEGFGPQMRKVIEAVDRDLLGVAKYVHQDAKTTAAFVDRNRKLRPSIRLKKSKFPDGGYIVEARGKNQDKGYHAWLVEYGHLEYIHSIATGRRVPPHPYLRPAAEKGVNYALAKVGK